MDRILNSVNTPPSSTITIKQPMIIIITHVHKLNIIYFIHFWYFSLLFLVSKRNCGWMEIARQNAWWRHTIGKVQRPYRRQRQKSEGDCFSGKMFGLLACFCPQRCSRADHVVVHAWLSLCASAIGSVPVQSGSTQPRVPISSWTLTCGVDTQRNMKRASNYVRGELKRESTE